MGGIVERILFLVLLTTSLFLAGCGWKSVTMIGKTKKTSMFLLDLFILLAVLGFNADARTIKDIVIPVDGGNLVIKELLLNKVSIHNKDLLLDCKVQNNTSKDWGKAVFEVRFYSKDGTQYLDSYDKPYLFEARNIKKGETVTVDSTEFHLPDDAEISRYEVVLKQGEYPSDDIQIPVYCGGFVVKELLLRKKSLLDNDLLLTCKVVNNTTVDWSRIAFNVKFYDASKSSNGETTVFEIKNIKKGETVSVEEVKSYSTVKKEVEIKKYEVSLDFAASISAEQVVSTENGNFEFKDLVLDKADYGVGYYLKGSAKNNSTKDWNKISFKVKFFDKDGKQIKGNKQDSEITDQFFDFKKGELRPMEISPIDFSNGLVIAKSEIFFDTGEYPANYKFTMIKPKESKNLVYEDKFVKLLFNMSKLQLSFTLENKTNNPIKLDWNQVAYIDAAKKSHKVFHAGIKYEDRNGNLVPTTIPPTASIDDVISPTDYAYFVEGEHGGWKDLPILPEAPAAKAYKGKTLGIFMPLQINGKVINYLFTFKIADVQM